MKPGKKLSPEQLCQLAQAARRIGALGPGLVQALLHVSREEAEALLALLEAQGLIERVDGGNRAGCPCTGCPLRRICPLPPLRGRGTGVYRLSPRLLSLCSRAKG